MLVVIVKKKYFYFFILFFIFLLAVAEDLLTNGKCSFWRERTELMKVMLLSIWT